MPTILGVEIGDWNGDGILDQNDTAIGETALDVVVTAGGFLMSKLAGGDPEEWIVGLTAFADLIKDLLGYPDSGTYPNVADQLAAIKTNTDRLHPTTGTYYPKLELIDDHVLAIDASGGGLTTEEHDQLMSLDTSGPTDLSGVWTGTVVSNESSNELNDPTTGEVMAMLAQFLYGRALYEGLQVSWNPWFRVIGYSPETPQAALGSWLSPKTNSDLPALDLSLVEEGDTATSFLAREYPSYNWGTGDPGGRVLAGRNILPSSQYPGEAFYICTLTDADVRAFWPSSGGGTVNITNALSPIYPGVSGITLGSTVALSNGLEVTGPMAGLYIAITGQPPGAGRYRFGEVSSWMHAGAVVFCNDDGVFERAQSFGLDQQVLVPQTMASAASAIIRLNSGFTGTVAAWTVNE